MPAFDQVLVQPDAEAVVAAMLRAVVTANKRARVNRLAPDEPEYRRFAAEALGSTDGDRHWLPDPPDLWRGTVLRVAWWTDPLGRRHFRVAGRRYEPTNFYLEHPLGAAQPRPALLHVYPERVMIRTLPGQGAELIAVCGCGALGRPAALAWMGECCGPCHDHQEEHGRPLAGPGRPLGLAGHGAGVLGLAWPQPGRTLVSADERGEVRFWDVADGRQRTQRQLGVGAVDGNIGLATDGRRVIMAAYHEGLFWWDADGTGLHHWDEAYRYGYRTLAVSADGRTLAGSPFGQVEVWDVADPGTARLLHAHDTEASALAFSPDGRTLAAGDRGGHLALFDVAAGGQVALARLSDGRVHALAFSPDGRALLVGSDGMQGYAGTVFIHRPGALLVVHPSNLELVTTLPESEGTPQAVVFSPDGRTLAAAGSVGFSFNRPPVVRFWRYPDLAFLGGLEWHLGPVHALAFSPDGEWLASGSADGSVRLWPWRQLLGVEEGKASRRWRG
jgi:hypothetical protein